MSGKGWYFGRRKDGVSEIFYAMKKPTEGSHGRAYTSATGPYSTRAKAIAAAPYPAQMAAAHSRFGSRRVSPVRKKRNRMTRLLEEHDRRPKLRQRSSSRRNPLDLYTRQLLAKVRGELYDAKKFAEKARGEVKNALSKRHLDIVIREIGLTKASVDDRTEDVARIEERD